MAIAYNKGLVEIADGVHAYLQPDGGWGWNNAGLITGSDESLLVDTLFDLKLTREMLDSMSPVTLTRPITTVVNTHANGDHCYGNELVAGAGVVIVSSAAALVEMDETPPSMLAAMMGMVDSLPDHLASFLQRAFGPFEFNGITMSLPTRTFSGSLTLDVGGRSVELIEVGPAHTAGDVVVWFEGERVVFTGDILFIEGTPIIWAGPVEHWVTACDQIIALEADVIVPGHGPLTNADGVRAMAGYLQFVEDQSRVRFDAGMSAYEATFDLFGELGSTPYGEWGDPERLAINVETVWTTLQPGYVRPSIPDLFARMAEL